MHWDGKLLSLFSEQRDRIAILITREDDTEFLLEVPVSLNSTGRSMNAVVLKEVSKVGVKDKIIAFAFDTTALNTRMVQSACIWIQQDLGQSLLWLACIHHAHKIILKDVFHANLSFFFDPDIGIYKRLHNRWSTLDFSQTETVETLEDLVQFFATNDTARKMKDNPLAFLKKALEQKNHSREDYKELLSFSYLFFGGQDQTKPLRRPVALHQARWIAKAIYCLKFQMVQSHLSLTC